MECPQPPLGGAAKRAPSFEQVNSSPFTSGMPPGRPKQEQQQQQQQKQRRPDAKGVARPPPHRAATTLDIRSLPSLASPADGRPTHAALSTSYSAVSSRPPPADDDDWPLEPPPSVFSSGGGGRGPHRQASSSSLSSVYSIGERSTGSARSVSGSPRPGFASPMIDHTFGSPPSSPWILRPSSPGLSAASSSFTGSNAHTGYNPPVSTFHTPTLSYEHERAPARQPSAPVLPPGVSDAEAWRIMREAEAGGGAGRAGVGRRAFHVAQASKGWQPMAGYSSGALPLEGLSIHFITSQRLNVPALGLIALLYPPSPVGTSRLPEMPGALLSPTMSPPQSSSLHLPLQPKIAPSHVFHLGQSSSQEASLQGLINKRAGSPFSHAPSQSSTSASFSSGEHQQCITSPQFHHQQQQPKILQSSFESQLDSQSSITGSEARDPPGDDDDDESQVGGQGLGERFLNLGDISDDSDDDYRQLPPPGSSLRAGLLNAVQDGLTAGSNTRRLPPANQLGSSRASSNQTTSSNFSRRQLSTVESANSAPVTSPASAVNRLPALSSSADGQVQHEIISNSGPSSLSNGVSTLESMVNSMELVASSPSPSAKSMTSFPLPSAGIALATCDEPDLRLAKAALPPSGVRRQKMCMRCGCEVGGPTGKRFVAVLPDEVVEDADGRRSPPRVLCEADWRELYLPKCRRCGLAIESEAVSSSDGQLRGKWHRACFTCWACDASFETAEFHVLNDRPHCALCYHRQGNTLCQTCGRPIEGACAVLEGPIGQALRFHPSCLRCDRACPLIQAPEFD